MREHKRGYKFRIGSMVFVVIGYDDASHKYLCRLWNTDEIFYFSAKQISKKG